MKTGSTAGRSYGSNAVNVSFSFRSTLKSLMIDVPFNAMSISSILSSVHLRTGLGVCLRPRSQRFVDDRKSFFQLSPGRARASADGRVHCPSDLFLNQFMS